MNKQTPSPEAGALATFAIERLGRRGDGLNADGEVVEGALPGETVRARRLEGKAWRVVEIVTASRDRVEPDCAVADRCGGCAVRGLSRPAELAWKHARIETALAREGLAAELAAPIDAAGEGRRRAQLTARRLGKSGPWRLGFQERRSHRTAFTETCPALAPSLQRVMAGLPEPLGWLEAKRPKDGLRITLLATHTGPLADIAGAREPSPLTRQDLALWAGAAGLSQLSLDGEPVAQPREPLIAMGRVSVRAAPSMFLQATEAGEETLSRLVLEALERAGPGPAADLFCGAGPFALRMAETRPVTAYDLGAGMIGALAAAARAAGAALRPIEARPRDLFRDPLTPKELSGFAAAVLNPPREGAQTQCRSVADSALPLLVYVSCDPETFARDAATLCGAGYALSPVQPVDQFARAAHIELVGVFERT